MLPLMLLLRRLQIALNNIAFVTLIFGAKMHFRLYNAAIHCNQIAVCCIAFPINTYCIGLMDNNDWGGKMKQMNYKGSNFFFVFQIACY